MAPRKDPHEEASKHVIDFLLHTQLPWSSFEQTFETLQEVVINTLAFSTSKAVLTVLIRSIYEEYERTNNTRKNSWERFYRKVFESLDREKDLPEGVRWERSGKNDWKLIKDETPEDVLGDLLLKAEKIKDEWVCEHGHPLVFKGLILTQAAEVLPKSQRKVTATVKVLSNSAYVVILELNLPLKGKSGGVDHMGQKYIDELSAESLIRKLLPRKSYLALERTRQREYSRTDGSYTERLNIILKG